MKAAVIGSGAWGTALAIRLCKNGHDVTMWTFEKDLIQEMETTRHNPRLPGAVLLEGLKISVIGKGQVIAEGAVVAPGDII